MGRKQRRAKEDPGVFKVSAVLAPAFPSSPSLPPRYHFYIHRDSKFIGSAAFVADYAAKKFLDLMLLGTEYEFVRPGVLPDGRLSPRKQVIECTNGLQICAHDDDFEVLEYEMTPQEEEWEIPEPYINNWMVLRDRLASGEPEPTPEKYVTSAERKAAKREAREARPKVERVAREPRASKDGLITAVMIAGEMKVDPKEARIALRASKEPKPDCGWAWQRSEVERIKGVITKHMKKR